MNQINKYFFYSSVILNAGLLMSVVGILPFLLYLSVLANLILVWFSVKCLNNAGEMEEDLEELMSKTDSFVEHLEGVYELEMFYGDETLQSMIDHSKQLINDYIEMQSKYFDVEVVEEELNDRDENKEEAPA